MWALSIPLLLVLATLGARFGGWYAGLAGVPAWDAMPPPTDPALAAALRNTALATVAALLIGLVGAVLGGWLASGEPMAFTYYRRRDVRDYDDRPRRVA